MVLEDVKIYLRQVEWLRKAAPDGFSLTELAVFFLPWKRSLRAHANALNDERPWITFAAIRFLERILTREMRVYEYGSGGSTLFFAKRAGTVISVDHDPIWRERVHARIRSRGHDNVELRLIKPAHDRRSEGEDPADPGAYISGAGAFSGYSFRDYVSSIDAYPDDSFDLVLIDGRARPSCFLHSMPKVKRNGHIVWDNTERAHYHPAMARAPAEFAFLDFPGPSPYVSFFTRTSAWRKVR